MSPVQSSRPNPGRRRQSQTAKAWRRGDFEDDLGIKSGGEVASDSGPGWTTARTSTGGGAVRGHVSFGYGAGLPRAPAHSLLLRAHFSLRYSCRQAELEGFEDPWAGVPPDPQIIHILLENRHVRPKRS